MEMVEARRKAEKKEERYDLFSSLLDASDDQQDGGAKLTDRELLGWFLVYDSITILIDCAIGNIFIFLLAGQFVIIKLSIKNLRLNCLFVTGHEACIALSLWLIPAGLFFVTKDYCAYSLLHLCTTRVSSRRTRNSISAYQKRAQRWQRAGMYFLSVDFSCSYLRCLLQRYEDMNKLTQSTA